jgi:hypothetical protein
VNRSRNELQKSKATTAFSWLPQLSLLRSFTSHESLHLAAPGLQGGGRFYPSIVSSRIDDPTRIVVSSDQREPRDLQFYSTMLPSRIHCKSFTITNLSFSTRQNSHPSLTVVAEDCGNCNRFSPAFVEAWCGTLGAVSAPVTPGRNSKRAPVAHQGGKI